MVFCNMNKQQVNVVVEKGHNPYFNRWFSAMYPIKSDECQTMCHNPYFNRWFSAIHIIMI